MSITVKTIDEYLNEEEENAEYALYDPMGDMQAVVDEFKLQLDQLNTYAETIKNAVGKTNEPNVRVKFLLGKATENLKAAVIHTKQAHLRAMDQSHSERF